MKCALKYIFQEYDIWHIDVNVKCNVTKNNIIIKKLIKSLIILNDRYIFRV